MAAKVPKEYVTVFIGSQTKVVNKKVIVTKVYSRLDAKVATKLGAKGLPGGVKLIRKVLKGAAAGSTYEVYQLGSRGKGYKLGFLNVANSSDLASKTRNAGYRGVNIPVPSGTPLSVIAQFAQTLKPKPQKIITPKGGTFYLNNSANSQGK
jgi:hypothetical protein